MAISILLSSDTGEMASEESVSVACVPADRRRERLVVDDGNVPSATSLNDNRSQDRPVLCLNASDVYFEGLVVDDNSIMYKRDGNYGIGCHDIWLGKFRTNRYNWNFAPSLWLRCVALRALAKILSQLEPFCKSYRHFAAARSISDMQAISKMRSLSHLPENGSFSQSTCNYGVETD